MHVHVLPGGKALEACPPHSSLWLSQESGIWKVERLNIIQCASIIGLVRMSVCDFGK